MNCSAQGDQTLRVSWNREYAEFTSHRASVRADGTLIITQLVPEDSGKYFCTAESVGGAVKISTEMNLVVVKSESLGYDYWTLNANLISLKIRHVAVSFSIVYFIFFLIFLFFGVSHNPRLWKARCVRVRVRVPRCRVKNNFFHFCLTTNSSFMNFNERLKLETWVLVSSSRNNLTIITSFRIKKCGSILKTKAIVY